MEALTVLRYYRYNVYVDKIYNIIRGSKTLFLGTGEPIEKSAKGMCDALKTAYVNILGNENFNKMLNKHHL